MKATLQSSGASGPAEASQSKEAHAYKEVIFQEERGVEAAPPAWRSPLTRRILLVNMLVLLIPVLGLLHLEQYRQSLIDSEIEAM